MDLSERIAELMGNRNGKHANVAQRKEQAVSTGKGAGSSPAVGANSGEGPPKDRDFRPGLSTFQGGPSLDASQTPADEQVDTDPATAPKTSLRGSLAQQLASLAPSPAARSSQSPLKGVRDRLQPEEAEWAEIPPANNGRQKDGPGAWKPEPSRWIGNDAATGDRSTSASKDTRQYAQGQHSGSQEEPEWVKPPREAEDFLEQVPPHDVHAEMSIIGAIFCKQGEPMETFEQVQKIVSPLDFYRPSHAQIYGAMQACWRQRQGIDAVTVEFELKQRGYIESSGGADYIAELCAFVPTPAYADHYAKIVRELAIKRQIASRALALREAANDGLSAVALLERAKDLVNIDGSSLRPARSIITENYADAIAENEAYLSRPEVIERLGYSQASCLFVGGKHHGKSTCIRTMAMAVVRGWDLWGRKTSQGHVIYAVSDDELAATRMELLRMGWQEGHDPLTIVHKDPDSVIEDPQRVLDDIAEEALHYQSVMVVFDMLFDFAGIRDEMGYAHTREAVGKIQKLANATKAFTLSSHHSPKYLLDTASAATAALGSQGIAARFSPIILGRRWTEGLYTIESTMTRDPRGKALDARVIKLDDNRWAQDGGEFKQWMKWKIYEPRIMALYDGMETGSGLSVAQVAKDLEIPRPVAQNALFQLSKANTLFRQKHGRGFKYYVRTGDALPGLLDESNPDQEAPF